MIPDRAAHGEVGARSVQVFKPDALTIRVDGLVEGVPPRLGVVGVVILEVAFAELGQIEVEVRPEAHAAAGASVDVNGAADLLVPIPFVGGEEVGAVFVAIAGDEIPAVGVGLEVALPFREPEDRHLAEVEDGILELDVIAGRDDDAGGADAIARIFHVVGGAKALGEHVNLGVGVAHEHVALEEVGGLPRFEVSARDAVVLEVVFQLCAFPDAALAFEAHPALGGTIPGLHVELHAIRVQHGVAIAHRDGIGVGDDAGAGDVLDVLTGDGPAVLRLLFRRHGGSQSSQQQQKKDDAQAWHWARTVKQRRAALPSVEFYAPPTQAIQASGKRASSVSHRERQLTNAPPHYR